MSSLPDEIPFVIETKKQAEQIGWVLHKVVRINAMWALRVFGGDPRMHWMTGPKVLNDELAWMWRHDWTKEQKEQIVAKYVAMRLS